MAGTNTFMFIPLEESGEERRELKAIDCTALGEEEDAMKKRKRQVKGLGRGVLKTDKSQ